VHLDYYLEILSPSFCLAYSHSCSFIFDLTIYWDFKTGKQKLVAVYLHYTSCFGEMYEPKNLFCSIIPDICLRLNQYFSESL